MGYSRLEPRVSATPPSRRADVGATDSGKTVYPGGRCVPAGIYQGVYSRVYIAGVSHLGVHSGYPTWVFLRVYTTWVFLRVYTTWVYLGYAPLGVPRVCTTGCTSGCATGCTSGCATGCITWVVSRV